MNDEKHVIQDTANALGLGSVIPEAYRDLLQPSAREVGAGLMVVARAVRIALAPIEATVWGYDRIRDWLEVRLTAKLAMTPPENIVRSPGHISGPTVLNLHFAADEDELREMYANLLATSMDRARVSAAHPAFVSIIQQLSSDEARILSAISSRESTDLFQEVLGSNGFPRSGGEWLFSQWRSFCASLELQAEENADAYLDNLVRLRILETRISSESHYNAAFADRHGDYPPSVDQTTTTDVCVTNFGQQFIVTCVLEPGVGNPWT